MSIKSGTSDQVISLPKGGGALSGIGEKFSPDLFTGTGNFSVPIALPQGRNGFQPDLKLVYSTGNGGGPFGMGWSLSVPGVGRKTSQGIPRYDDLRDVFVLSGAEDLVLVEETDQTDQQGTQRRTRYRPRTEGLFARIEHLQIVYADPQAPAADYWEVRSKDGTLSIYGTAPEDRPPDAGSDWVDPAVIADPGNRSRIFTWQLTRTQDTFGNRILYEYERDTGRGNGRHWDQLYLNTIRYVDYLDSQGEEQYLVSVVFEYETLPDRYGDDISDGRRIYPFSFHRAGFEIRTRKRCRRIAIRTDADQERLVRTVDLTYFDQRDDLPDLEQRLPRNGVSLLSSIQLTGHDLDQSDPARRTESWPPLEFDYTPFNPQDRDFFSIEGQELPNRSLASPELELADLFGNGLPDIVEMTGGQARYWRNLGTGRFDLPRAMRDTPAGYSLEEPGVQLLDANGDGRVDLVIMADGSEGSLAGYFPLRFSGEWDRRSFQHYRVAPSFSLEDPDTRVVDLTGDGVIDAIRSGSRLECFFNDPRQGWGEVRWLERRALDQFPNVSFSDPRVQWGDLSGDGMQDIILIHDGRIAYWPNLGYGNWGPQVVMQHCPRLPTGYDPRRLLVGDVDGDGLADIVYVDDTRVTLWINQSGAAWSDPVEIPGTPPVSDMDAVRLVDMLGTGVGGVLWTRDALGAIRDHYNFLDFTGSVKPYVLNTMDNHIGSVTRVEYAPSTRFYLEDFARPQSRWKTPLPFSVQVVSRVEETDQISGGKLTTEYRYHHGYWDGGEREFRGFGRVDKRDSEVFQRYHNPGLPPTVPFQAVEEVMFSPPVETRMWFHQGPIGDEFGDWEEMDYSSEFWPEDPNLLDRPPEMVTFLDGLPRQARRDALRTLRGQTLRTEEYGLDDTSLQTRPYLVVELQHGVAAISGGEGTDGQPRIFFPHQLTKRATIWERGSDPMTHFVFAGDYDDYGQVRSEFTIAVPRGGDFRVSDPGREPYLATLKETTRAQRDDEERYLVDRVARITNFEVLNDGTTALFDLADTIRSGQAALEIVGQSLNFYDGPAFCGLPFGELGDFGALVRTETLLLSEEILAQAYPARDVIPTPPDEPPFFATSGAPRWPAEYPEDFVEYYPSDRHTDSSRPDLAITPLGYGFASGESDSPYARGLFAATARHCYDFQDGSGRQGLPTASRDPLGRDDGARDGYMEYDDDSLDIDLRLLPTRSTDPAGLVTKATYDCRVLQPRLVIDANGNRTLYTYTPLNYLASTAVMGKGGEAVGDTPELPGTSYEYSLRAFDRTDQPLAVHTTNRVYHANDSAAPALERDETIHTVEFSDGFGRLLQTRTLTEDVAFGDPAFGGNLLSPDQDAEHETIAVVEGRRRAESDPPNVVVSGWQTFNNKGEVVEKYEPFFSTGWAYLTPAEERDRGGMEVHGRKISIYYDPRGRVIRTVNPDGSERFTVLGVPGAFNSPDPVQPGAFEPTAWENYIYDENDNAGRTHPAESAGYEFHRDSPSRILVDPLGRVIESVESNRAAPEPGASMPPLETYSTRVAFDIRGNPLRVTDPLGRRSFFYVYDLTPPGDDDDDEKEVSRVLRIEQLDAGIRRLVLDAAGNEVERRDSKGALVLRAYDPLNRLTHVWARDEAGSAVTLRERHEYGDGGDREQDPRERADQGAQNRLGRLHRHYDEAGLSTYEAYDFKGNSLEKVRRVISDRAILDVFDQSGPDWQVRAFRVDWHPPSGVPLAEHAAELLDPIEYRTSATYDALDRVTMLRNPQDVEGDRKELRFHYNRAGMVEHVELAGRSFLEYVAYNAKGQRTLVVDGSGVMSRFAHDPATFRVVRLRSERCSRSGDVTFVPSGQVLQDYAYRYDLVGNLATLRDRTPGCGLPVQPDELERAFSYDPLYRLLSATGRECEVAPPSTPWDDAPRCQDVTRTQGYTEAYSYDAAGNMIQMRHQAHIPGNIGGFTRDYALVAGANGLAALSIGNHDVWQGRYLHDANGNMTGETTSRHFEWDHSDRMRIYRTQVDGAEPSVHAHYLYNSAGKRVKKLVRKQGGRIETTVYIGQSFEHHCQGVDENNTLHVVVNEMRSAQVRVGHAFDGDPSPAVQYQLADHLASSNVVSDDAGRWINREEFTPFGETSFGGYAKKRYRFTGKERDEESGLNYHEARYYAPWLGRWTSCDPLSLTAKPAENNQYVYVYCDNNPLKFVDHKGKLPTIAAAVVFGLMCGVVGMLISLAIQGVVDAFTSLSDWQAYVGAAAGGFVGSFVLGMMSILGMGAVAPWVSGAVGAFVTSVTQQGLRSVFGTAEQRQAGIDWTQVTWDTGLGLVLGGFLGNNGRGLARMAGPIGRLLRGIGLNPNLGSSTTIIQGLHWLSQITEHPRVTMTVGRLLENLRTSVRGARGLVQSTAPIQGAAATTGANRARDAIAASLGRRQIDTPLWIDGRMTSVRYDRDSGMWAVVEQPNLRVSSERVMKALRAMAPPVQRGQ